MTVCVATLANDGKVIVLIADKALTYGDNVYRPAMQSEGGVKKMLALGDSGWVALLAGDSTAAEQVVEKATQLIEGNPDIAKSHNRIMNCVKEAFQQVREDSVIDAILRPQLLTKELLVARDTSLLPLAGC
jgi:hypothetical protein